MLVIPKPAVSPRDAAAPTQPSHRSTDHAPLAEAGAVAKPVAVHAQGHVATAPATVLITERQVMFATAAGVAPRPVAAPRPRFVAFWHRLMQSVEPRPPRKYPYTRPSYLEQAAMSREMERL
nr:hypothetical protein MFLOJ_34990 [Mycobacterium florentinum]